MSYFITLKIDASNDPITAGLEINAATADEPVLILQTTDDDATNPFLEMQKADNTVLHSIGQSAIQFQPAADSTTFLQILDADGGTPILNIDSTNERVGIGLAAPLAKLEINVATADEPVLILQTTDDDDTNNIQEWQDSAGAVLSSINNVGNLAIGGATNYRLTISGLAKGTVYLGITPGASAVANDTLVWGAAQLAGDIYIWQGSIVATGVSYFRNSNSSATANAHAAYWAVSAGASGGDPKLMLSISGVKDWAVGLDNSDSDRFKISGSHDFSSATYLSIGATGGVLINEFAAAIVGLTVKSAPSQTANLFELQESDGSIMLASGDGLGGSVFAGNVQLEDIDFVWSGDTEANLFRIDAGADEVRLGDWDTNYAAFEIDGTLRFEGNARVWDDLYFPMSSGKVGGANQPTWAAFQGNTYEYTFAINDYIHLPSGEIIHKYLEGSDIELHAHIVLDGSDVGNTYVNYEIEYTIGDMGEVMAGAVAVTSGDTLIVGGTADRTHVYIAIDTIAGAGYKIGAALKMRFRRIALVGGGLNAPTNDPFVMMVGAHIEEDTVGSRTELDK